MGEFVFRASGSSEVRRRTLRALALAFAASACTTCNTAQQIGAAAVAVGGMTPGQEIEQVYYLGVLDPMEQLPTSLYRVHVRGEASLISKTKFASGWVPSEAVDSLTSTPVFGPEGGVTIDRSGEREALVRLALTRSALATATKERTDLDSEVETLTNAEAAAKDAVALERAAQQGIKTAVTSKAGNTVASRVAEVVAARQATESLTTKASDLVTAALTGAPALSKVADEAHRTEVATALRGRETLIRAKLTLLDDQIGHVLAELLADGTAKLVSEAVRDSDTLKELAWGRFIPETADEIRKRFLSASNDGIGALVLQGADAAVSSFYGEAFPHIEDLRDIVRAVVKDVLNKKIAAPFGKRASDVAESTAKLLGAAAAGQAAADPTIELQKKADAAAEATRSKKSKLAQARLAELNAKARVDAEQTLVDSSKSGTGFTVGRRLVLFGPEGFRESPANNRLVIMMGTTPEDFFNAASGTITQAERVTAADESAKIATAMRTAMGAIAASSDRLEEIERRAEADLSK